MLNKAQLIAQAIKKQQQKHPAPAKGKKPAPKPSKGTPVYESENGEANAASENENTEPMQAPATKGKRPAVPASNPSGKPSAGMSKQAKGKAVKQAKKGKDFGKKNVPGKSGFNTVQQKAAKEYGSQDAGKKVAGAVFWKKFKRGA